jgi:hypothetical protein
LNEEEENTRNIEWYCEIDRKEDEDPFRNQNEEKLTFILLSFILNLKKENGIL